MTKIRDALYSDLARRHYILKDTRIQGVLTELMEKGILSAYQYRRNKRLDLSAKMKHKITTQIWKKKLTKGLGLEK